MFAASRFARPLARHVLRQRGFLSVQAESHLIINAVGQDRLGIVSDVAGMVIDAGGNVGDSQAAKLGSHFSLMMVVSVPTEQLDSLKEKLGSMPDINAAVFEADDVEEKHTPAIGYSGYFSLEGADNPGIVHKITTALAKHGLSIEKIETGQEIGPYGGTVLFKMHGVATAAAPLASGFDISKIKKELVELGDQLNCDVTMEDKHDDSDDASFYSG